MNAEFVAKARQRGYRDLANTARMGWLLYPLGILLAFVSGLAKHSPRFFAGVTLVLLSLLAWRFFCRRDNEAQGERVPRFALRLALASATWGILVSYGSAHLQGDPYALLLHFGSLAIIGVGGLVMYTSVFWVYLVYMGAYALAFSLGLLWWYGPKGIMHLVGSLLVQAGLLWVGHRLYLSHSRAVVSSLLLERRARELETAYHKLELSNQHRVRFMQSLAAELHSALDGINRVSEFLRQTPLGDEQLRMVEASRRTTGELVQYLEGISEITALESGKAEFIMEQIYLPRTLGGLFEEISSQALLSGRSFVYRIQPGLPEVALSDRHRLQQLVRIMAENCMRMTDAGGTIRLHAEWKEQSTEKGLLLLRFTDTGVGMDTAQIRNLIEDAYLAQNEVESPLRGASLHFALLGRILFRMHGHFRVQSLPESGNVYEIELPLQVVAWMGHASEELEAGFDSLGLDESDLPRLLLVDDNALSQRLLGKLCSTWGYTLEIASGGAQALQWIELRRFDLAILDLLSLGDEADATVGAMRQSSAETHQPLPLLALCADGQGEGQRAATRAGVDAFVAKPFAPDTLYQTITELIALPHA